MSDRLEQELASLFQERADQIPDTVEAPDGLTTRVRRRIRRRRQSAVASLTVVAVAAGLASAVLLRDDGPDRVRVRPAGTMAPPTETTETTEVHRWLIDYFAPVSGASVRNGWVVRDAWAVEENRRVSACLEEQGFPPLGEYVGDPTSWWYFPDEETLRTVGFRQSVPAAENFGTPPPTGDDYRQGLDECGAQALLPEPGRSAGARMDDWHTDVVEPAVARPEEQELWSAAAACLRARGYADEWLDTEEHFVGEVGGSVMRIADNDVRLARELEIADDYIECAKPVWTARTAWLVEQRKSWVEKHHDDLVTVQRALDEYLRGEPGADLTTTSVLNRVDHTIEVVPDLAIASERGVSLSTGGAVTQIADEAAAVAYAVGSDLVVYQAGGLPDVFPFDTGPIRVWSNGELHDLPTNAEADRAVLLDARVVDGAPVALVSEQFDGMPEDTSEELVFVGLRDGARTTVVRRPAWESGLRSARILADGSVIGLYSYEAKRFLARWSVGADDPLWTAEAGIDAVLDLAVRDDGKIAVIQHTYRDDQSILVVRSYDPASGALEGEAESAIETGTCRDWLSETTFVCSGGGVPEEVPAGGGEPEPISSETGATVTVVRPAS